MPKSVDSQGARKLWAWMTAKDTTLEALAKKLGVTPNYLSDLRRGVHRPSDDLKFAIERITEIPPAAWLQPVRESAS